VRTIGGSSLGVLAVVSTNALMILRCPLYLLWMRSVISAMPGDGQKPQSRLFRMPRRITITVPQATAEHLEQRSIREGRSHSNLAAVLLERAITAEQILSPQQGCHG
jgi:hypothetical protein